MYSKLFHKDVYMPLAAADNSKAIQKTLSSYYFSKHFKEHLENCFEDRSHKYLADIVTECLDSLKDTQRDVFEVELSKDYHFFGQSGWFITKYCCRIPYSYDQDLVVAIRPQYRDGKIVNNMIVTAWLNNKNDSHRTLDGSKYCSQYEWINTIRQETLKRK